MTTYRKIHSIWPLVGVMTILMSARPATGQRTVAAETTSSAAARAADVLLSRRMSINVKDVPLKRAIDAAAASARVPVQYEVQEIDAYHKSVTLHLTDVPLRVVLERLLAGTTLHVVPDGTTKLVIAEAQASSQPQATGTITGHVVDSASGRGLPGVTVAMPGINRSLMTTDAGRFAFENVPAGEHAMTFKALGYTVATRTVRVASGQSVPVRAVLAPSATVLSGVVTTATGMQRRVEVGNDITVLRVDSIMKTAPISSLTDLLESRVPGMTIQRTSGTPGDPARVRLRGTSSIYQNNDPIIVVDGIRMYSQQSDDRNLNTSGPSGTARTYNTPSPLDQIDPNTIETIEVLKGPSASAMYGSDAANGVIIVTTKRGQTGPPRWSVRASAGVSTMPGSWTDGLWKWVTPTNGGGPRLCISYCGDSRVDSIVRFQALNHPRLTALGKGSTFGSAVTVSGGTQAITYSFTGSTSNEDGILKLPEIEKERYLRFQGEPAPGWMRRPDQLKGYSAQGSVMMQLSPAVTLAVSSTLSSQTQYRTSMSSTGGVGSAINQLQRTYVDLSQLAETPLLGNPYERVISENVNQVNSVQLGVRPWSWLPVTATVGTNTLTQTNQLSLARGLVTGDEAGGTLTGSTRTASGITGTAFTTIPLRRRLSLAAGMNFDRGRTNDQQGTLRGIPEDVTDPSVGQDTARNQFQRNTSERKSFGWFLEPKLDIASRFFVMPGFRLDNNGLAGRNAGLNGLPKMNVSWVMSEESFFPLKDLVNLFRVRAAYGVSGVQPRPGDLNRLYERIDGNPLSGSEPFYGRMLSLQYLGNTRLRPERGTELESGIDVDLWDNRVNTTVTYYRKRRKDAIIPNQYATSIDGGGEISMNVGDLANSGLELTLGAQVVQRQSIGLSFNATYNRLRSKVERLNSDGAIVLSFQGGGLAGNRSDTRYVVGYPVESLWEIPIIGYSDLDGNGWITESEIAFGAEPRYMGTTEPAHQVTFAPTVNVLNGRVGLYAIFSYVGGQVQSFAAGGVTVGSFRGAPYETDIVQGPDGFGRQAALIGLRGGTAIGYMQKVNAVRFQSLSLNVNLGPSAARLVKARSASLALQGSNLGLWTNYIGVDPNVNGASGGRGLADTGQQPQPREWRLNLSLGY